MSFKLRKLATNMNVIKNMIFIKNMVRAMGKNKLQGNGAFNDTVVTAAHPLLAAPPPNHGLRLSSVCITDRGERI